MRHFIDSLRDEVRIFRRLPKRYSSKYGYKMFEMPPVSWSDENYYLKQVARMCSFFMFLLMRYLIVNSFPGVASFQQT